MKKQKEVDEVDEIEGIDGESSQNYVEIELGGKIIAVVKSDRFQFILYQKGDGLVVDKKGQIIKWGHPSYQRTLDGLLDELFETGSRYAFSEAKVFHEAMEKVFDYRVKWLAKLDEMIKKITGSPTEKGLDYKG
jgi:hypothetical protein